MFLDEITIVDRHRTDLGDIAGLAASMRSVGLLQPVLVNDRGRLIAGARRIAAARLLGWDAIEVCMVSDRDSAIYQLCMERDENECRKEMTPSERVRLARALEELERSKAAERQVSGLKVGNSRAVPGNGAGKPTLKYDTREVVAPAVGLSPATYTRAKALVVAADAGDADAQRAVAQMDATGQVTPAYRAWAGENAGGVARPTAVVPLGTRTYKAAGQQASIPRVLSNLTGLTKGIRSIRAVDPTVTPEQAASWASDLLPSIQALRTFHAMLKEHSHDSSR